jgi:ribonuclease HI
MTNTTNRAELTGIAAALTNKYTQIATDSACSLSQIRKQLLCQIKLRSLQSIRLSTSTDGYRRHTIINKTGHPAY